MKNFYYLILFFTASVVAQPVANQPAPYTLCDQDNDGTEIFDLTTKDAEILGGADDSVYSVTYFPSLADALNNVNPIINPAAYNGTDGEFLGVRVYMIDLPSTFDTTTLDLQLIAVMVPTISAPDAVCSQDQVWFSVTGGTGPFIYEYSIDGVQAAPIQGGNTVNVDIPTTPGFYEIALTSVYSQACAVTNDLPFVTIEVLESPEEILAPDLTITEDPFDGVAEFDFSPQTDLYLNSETGISVTYHLSQPDAEAATNALVPGLFTNTLNPQMIWARIQDDVTGCFYVDGFQLIVIASGVDYITFPDANLKAVLLAANPNNNTAFAGPNPWNPLPAVSVDTNTDGEIQYTEALAITGLYIENAGISDIEGLQFFTNLHLLALPNNDIAAFDATLFNNLQDFRCNGNMISFLDVSHLPELCLFDCSDNPPLSALLMKNGDAGCYLEYQIYENPNLAYVCTDANEVTHFINQLGLNGMANVYVSDICTPEPGGTYNLIEGYVKFDGDNNGCTTGDPTFDGIRVDLQQGANTIATYTDENGMYRFYTQEGTFEITTNFENEPFFTISPVDATVTFAASDGSVSTNNFCINGVGVHSDLEVTIAPITPARPGFDAVYKIVYKNKGNQIMTQDYAVNFFYNENLVDFVSAVPAPDQQNAGAISYSYADLMPFESRSFIVTLNVNAPTDTPAVNIGDILGFNAVIAPVGTDATPVDNNFIFNQTVVGAYDPNDKICIQGATVSPTQIGEYLHYVINFENTGNFYAQNVMVRDVINEPQFDLSTLQILDSSHPVYARLSGNTVDFHFENIYLDSGGHGNILLKIKTLSTLVTGDQVSNKADIFFDYNVPIITNDAVTLFSTLDVYNPEASAQFTMSPNPANTQVRFSASSMIYSIQVFDVHGRLLQTSIVNDTSAIIDISKRQTGFYFMKVQTDAGSTVQKLVKN